MHTKHYPAPSQKGIVPLGTLTVIVHTSYYKQYPNYQPAVESELIW